MIDYLAESEKNFARRDVFSYAARCVNEAYMSAFRMCDEMVLGPAAVEQFHSELAILADSITALETLVGRAHIHAVMLSERAVEGPLEI